MNGREWILSRTPAPPPQLASRLAESLGVEQIGEPSEVCLDAAVALLHRVLADSDPGRAGAFDLLTVDALVTYAFEAAGEQLPTMDDRATAAMVRLAALADDQPSAA